MVLLGVALVVMDASINAVMEILRELAVVVVSPVVAVASFGEFFHVALPSGVDVTINLCVCLM